MDLSPIVKKARKYVYGFNEAQFRQAFEFASEAHATQIRKSGEPYINHSLATASNLLNLRVDKNTFLAAILHDIPGNTTKTVEDIEQIFGHDIAYLVDGVTKLSKVQYRQDMATDQVEVLRKMFLVIAKDLRVVLIKLADRLHNMETLQAVNQEKAKRIAEETIEIYAPLAGRLGIWQFKWRLEDLCFAYLWPEQFKELENLLQEGREEREKYIQVVKRVLKKEMNQASLTVRIEGRTKHLYSIYQKMQRKKKSFAEIYDILALRIITMDVRECYMVLGILHDLWKPKPGRFKDYIAVPKANGYQSLHTTVFCLHGKLTEFQIRTEKMDEESEFGLPAHWYYAETRGNRKIAEINFGREQLAWVKTLSELQENAKDDQEFLEGLKIDIFKDRIFVFTPLGDVKDLPKGANCIDFAYSVHTELGHACVGTKVNGAITPLNTTLKTGDVVDVLTSKTALGPKRDWLKLVKTTYAKNKIRAWFRAIDNDKNIAEGMALLQAELDKMKKGARVSNLAKERIAAVLKDSPYVQFEDVLAAIGEGVLSVIQVLKKMYLPEELMKPVTKKPTQVISKALLDAEKEILVEGQNNLLVKFAQCCNPQIGDKILGYVTVGKGISIHKKNCKSAGSLAKNKFLKVAWRQAENNDEVQPYLVTILIKGIDRIGLLRDIASSLVDLNINVVEIISSPMKASKHFQIKLTISILSIDQLGEVFVMLEQINGVLEVRKKD